MNTVIKALKGLTRNPYLVPLLLFSVFALLFFFFDQRLDQEITSTENRIKAIQKNKQQSMDFLNNKKNYIFESTIKLNTYISNFIANEIHKNKTMNLLSMSQKKMKQVKFSQFYLPIDVIGFDLAVKGKFMTILDLTEKLKKSPFLIVWEKFNFSIIETEYPAGKAHLVFYTFIKRS